jgi:hypothetical protein
MHLADAGWADEDDTGALAHEAECGRALDEVAVDAFRKLGEKED